MRALVIALLVVFAAPARADKVKVTATELVLAEPIYFDVGKATIKPTSRPILDALVRTLQKNPKLALDDMARWAARR